ncbi:hypothetical protein CRUP_030165, partial [Coryphaenoides rupestris]
MAGDPVQVAPLIFSYCLALLQLLSVVEVSLTNLCGWLEELDYQEDALSTLRSLLEQDLERYRDLHQDQGHSKGLVTERVLEEPNRAQDIGAALPSMHGKSESEMELHN